MNDLRIWLGFGVLMLLDVAIETIKTYWVVFAVLAIILLALFIFLNQPVSAEASRVEVRTVETPKPELGLREQKLARVFQESADIVSTSANIETVDSRYEVMMRVGQELATVPSPELDGFRSEFYAFDAVGIFNEAADRYISRQVYEISALKTANGRNRRIAKIEGIIDGLKNMPLESKNYAKKILRAGLE